MVVRMDYELALDDGELIDSSAETGPLEFVQGSGEIIEGLAEALYGMAAGEEKQVVVTPDLAYGDYDPEAYQVVPRDSFPPDVDLSEGDPLDLFDEETGEHPDEHGDHDPFGCEEHGTCMAFGALGLTMEPQMAAFHLPVLDRPVAVLFDEGALAAFSGSKWNPPKA